MSENSSVINWSNRIEIPGSPQWQADLYQTEHSLVPIFSDDDLSTKEGAIPLTIISRKGRTNAVPLLLIGYGSYGVSVPMSFRPELTVLLEKGADSCQIIAFK